VSPDEGIGMSAVVSTNIAPEYESIDQFQKSSKRTPSLQQDTVDPSNVHAQITPSETGIERHGYQPLDFAVSATDEDVYEDIQLDTRTGSHDNQPDTDRTDDRTTYQALTEEFQQPAYESMHVYANTKAESQI